MKMKARRVSRILSLPLDLHTYSIRLNRTIEYEQPTDLGHPFGSIAS